VDSLATLSDGVFAIAMTLLVLDLKLPATEAIHQERELQAALIALAPRFLMFITSFLTLGIFWIAQRTQLGYLSHGDRHFAWAQIGFLACASLLPFSTTLLAEFAGLRTALLVYWLNLFMLGALLYLSCAYADRANLVTDKDSIRLHAAMKQRIVVGQALYALGALLSFVSSYLALGFILFLQINFALAPPVLSIPHWAERLVQRWRG
jgi:uncharacterized membrane protein